MNIEAGRQANKSVIFQYTRVTDSKNAAFKQQPQSFAIVVNDQQIVSKINHMSDNIFKLWCVCVCVRACVRVRACVCVRACVTMLFMCVHMRECGM